MSKSPIWPKVPAEMLRAMGFLVGAASSAEYQLGCQILRLIADDVPVGHAYPLVAGMEAKVKINMIRIFLKMFSLDEERHINNILDQIISMFEKRNEIAHSVLIQDQEKGAPIKFQDLRARIKLGHMPQAQVRTAKEIAGHARQLVTLCQQLETALTRAGVPTTIQLYANVVARHEFESQMARARAHRQSPPTTDKKSPPPNRWRK